MKKISAQKTHEKISAKKKCTKFIHEKKQCTKKIRGTKNVHEIHQREKNTAQKKFKKNSAQKNS